LKRGGVHEKEFRAATFSVDQAQVCPAAHGVFAYTDCGGGGTDGNMGHGAVLLETGLRDKGDAVDNSTGDIALG
jgi:hypothetical protein